jgi:hypothetical protein
MNLGSDSEEGGYVTLHFILMIVKHPPYLSKVLEILDSKSEIEG